MKNIPPKNPHFFKPILPGFKNGVNIPTAFLAKYLRGQGPKFAILRRGDLRWRVKINGRMLADGWEKFAAENGLHVGDFVVFRHEGNTVFDVSVFEPSQCEREYPRGCSVPQPSKNFCSADLNQKSAPVDEGSVPDLERAESNLQDTDIKHKRTSTSKDDHPFFVSTLHHYSLKLSHLNIPSDFARENGLWNRQCKMFLRDLKQRSWLVELDCTRNRVSIKHGWDKFCGANGLVEGDTFVFKLIDNGETPIAKVYAQGTASTSSADHPHFVSTIKPYCLKKPNLYLPIEFARSHGLVEAEKREMILRDDKERSWSVVLGRIGRHFGLLRGWHAFQMANGLKEGDAYKFELIESGKKPIAKFHSIAQGTTSTSSADHPHFVSTIKPYCLRRPHLYLPIEFARSHGLVEAEKREMILRDDKERSWSVVLGRMGHQVCLLQGWHAFQMANGLKEGDACKFELIESGKKPIAKFHSIAQGTASTSSADHPHFVSTIKPYCLKNQNLYLPIEFARSHGLVEAKKREMILRDDKERSWSVVLGRTGRHFGLLRGWHAFQMANGLKEGDAYKFELIESGKKPIAKFHCHFSGQKN